LIKCLVWNGLDQIQFNFNTCFKGYFVTKSSNAPVNPLALSTTTFAGVSIYAYIYNSSGVVIQRFISTMGINNYLTNYTSGAPSGEYANTLCFNGVLNNGDYILLTGTTNSVFNNLGFDVYKFSVLGNDFPFSTVNSSTITITYMKNA
jgi:hypothetical protein